MWEANVHQVGGRALVEVIDIIASKGNLWSFKGVNEGFHAEILEVVIGKTGVKTDVCCSVGIVWFHNDDFVLSGWDGGGWSAIKGVSFDVFTSTSELGIVDS